MRGMKQAIEDKNQPVYPVERETNADHSLYCSVDSVSLLDSGSGSFGQTVGPFTASPIKHTHTFLGRVTGV